MCVQRSSSHHRPSVFDPSIALADTSYGRRLIRADYVTVRIPSLNWMIRELNPEFTQPPDKTLNNFS